MTDLKACLKKLYSIVRLDSCWDGYHAKTISNKIYNLAKLVLEDQEFQPEIFPTPNGTIQFTWQTKTVYLEAEILGNRIDVFVINEVGDNKLFSFFAHQYKIVKVITILISQNKTNKVFELEESHY